MKVNVDFGSVEETRLCVFHNYLKSSPFYSTLQLCLLSFTYVLDVEVDLLHALLDSLLGPGHVSQLGVLHVVLISVHLDFILVELDVFNLVTSKRKHQVSKTRLYDQTVHSYTSAVTASRL